MGPVALTARVPERFRASLTIRRWNPHAWRIDGKGTVDLSPGPAPFPASYPRRGALFSLGRGMSNCIDVPLEPTTSAGFSSARRAGAMRIDERTLVSRIGSTRGWRASPTLVDALLLFALGCSSPPHAQQGASGGLLHRLISRRGGPSTTLGHDFSKVPPGQTIPAAGLGVDLVRSRTSPPVDSALSVTHGFSRDIR